MIYILAVLLAVAITVALYYRSKAEEFESLFELSKDYNTMPPITYKYSITNVDPNDLEIPMPRSYKLNKDGSIAKKRGWKPKA